MCLRPATSTNRPQAATVTYKENGAKSMNTPIETGNGHKTSLLQQRITELEQALAERDAALHAYQHYPHTSHAQELDVPDAAILFQALVATIPDAISVTTMDGTIIYANAAYAALTGYPCEEAIGLNTTYLYADPPPHQQTVRNHLTTHGTWQGIRPYRRKDSTIFQGQVSATLLYHNDGQPYAVAEIIRDVTDNIQLEEALHRSRAILRAFTDHSPAHVFVKDTQGQFLMANQSLSNALNLAPQDVVGKKDEELFTTDIVQRWHEQEYYVCANRQPIEIEEMLPHNGHRAPFLSTRFPIYDAQGEVYAIGSIATNITERKQNEAARRASEEAYRTLVEYSLQGLFIFQDGHIVFANPRMADITGYKVSELLTWTFDDINTHIHPNDQEVIWNILRKPRLSRRETRRYEVRIIHKNSKIRWIDLYAVQTRYRGEAATQVAYLDITERKQAETALRSSEERFRLMAEHAQDIVYRYRLYPSRGYEYISPSVTAITGYTPEEYYSDPDLDLKMIHPGSRPMFDSFNQTPDSFREPLLLPVIHKNGETIWIEQRHWLVQDETGQTIAFEGISRDVTKNKQAEENLRKSEERFRLLAENARDIVYRYRLLPTPGYEYISPSVTAITGYTPEEYYDDPDLDLKMLYPDQRALFDVLYQSSETLRESLVLPVTRKDGQQIWLEQRHWQVLDEGGNAIAIEGIARDITERKHAEAALRESEARYRAISELISDFVYAFRVEPDNTLVLEWMTDGFTRNTGFDKRKMQTQEGRHSLIHPDDLPSYQQHQQRLLSGHRNMNEYRILTRSGETRWLRSHGQPLWDGQKQRVIRIYGASQDITERKNAEDALQEANEQLTLWVSELEQLNNDATLVNAMSAALQNCLNVRDIYQVATRSITKLFEGFSGALYVAQDQHPHFEAVATWGYPPPTETIFPSKTCQSLQQNQSCMVDHTDPNVTGTHLGPAEPYSHFCVPLVAQGETLGVLHLRTYEPLAHSMRDRWEWLETMVAEHLSLALANSRLRERLREQSIRDPLTALFNRRYMTETLERELREATRHQRPIGIIMLDIDHFKRFNDDYGHTAGDAVLQHFAHFLQQNIRSEDIVCRYGGEEFIIIMPGATLDDTIKRAESLRQAIPQLPVVYEGQTLQTITSSFGVASFPDHGTTVDAVLLAADDALYQAKDEGRNRVVVGTAG